MWEKFNLIVPLQLRWTDMDAMQHLNNAVYLSYFEVARIAYWHHALEKTRLEDVSFILAEINVKYKSPAALGDRLSVGIRADELKNRSFKFLYEIWETRESRLVAQGMSVQVFYDYQEKKIAPMPEDLRRRMEAFEARGERLFLK